MDAFLEILPALVILGILVLWMVLHYRLKIAKQGISRADLKRLQTLQQTATHMEERVKVLEKILDVQAPNWRRSH